MLTLSYLFESGRPKIIKIEDKPNYTVEDYRNPAKNRMRTDPETGKPMYRRKTVIGKDGKKHIITLAIMKKPGKGGGFTKATSKWDHK